MSDLKLATTNYVDSHQSGGLKGEYTYENNHSIFKVGPGTELNLSGGYSVLTVDNYGPKSKLRGNSLELSVNEGDIVESKINITTGVGAFEPSAAIALSNPLDTSNKRVKFEFVNGDDTVWGINKYDGSLYVNGPVQFYGTITDKYGNEVTGGGGGGGTPYVWSHSEWTSYGSAEVLYLGKDESGNRASVFTSGPLYIDNTSIEFDNTNGHRY